MAEIGGNKTMYLYSKDTFTKNEIGENVPEQKLYKEINGFLDFNSGDSKYTNFNTKMQESTHYFICDYVEIEKKPKQLTAVIDNEKYDVMFVDDPMGLNEHLEIYLKYLES